MRVSQSVTNIVIIVEAATAAAAETQFLVPFLLRACLATGHLQYHQSPVVIDRKRFRPSIRPKRIFG
jgi:hypothetical protein